VVNRNQDTVMFVQQISPQEKIYNKKMQAL